MSESWSHGISPGALGWGFPPMRAAHRGVQCRVVTMLLSGESCLRGVVSTLVPVAGAVRRCEPLIVVSGVVVLQCRRRGDMRAPRGTEN